jgi:hypothetical protein
LPIEPWAGLLGVLAEERVALIPPYLFALR